MIHHGFTRRDFVSMGAVAAASALASTAAGQGTNDQVKKEKGMLNAIDFGAKGDGIADDTAAIQQALNAAGATNGSVFIPQGTYLCSELKVPVGIGIHGLPGMDYRKGMGSVLKFKGGSKSMMNLTGVYWPYLFGLCLHGGDIEGGG